MQKYAATVEVATKDYDGDAVMSHLEGFNTALGFSPRGWASATLTVPADSLYQAASIAVVVVANAFGVEAIACVILTERERDAREG
jgi:hypothetical protein